MMLRVSVLRPCERADSWTSPSGMLEIVLLAEQLAGTCAVGRAVSDIPLWCPSEDSGSGMFVEAVVVEEDAPTIEEEDS